MPTTHGLWMANTYRAMDSLWIVNFCKRARTSCAIDKYR